MREEFEAYITANTSWSIDRSSIGAYRDYDVYCAWLAYQAGALAMRERAAKEVNLETGMRHMAEKIRNLPVIE